jgi:O-antigen/teichoic acid export membrane protein
VKSLRQRIYLALAANAFGQAVTIGSQILLIPLFFSSWGAAKYGEWLIISTIPAYLMMADFGLGSAAGNEMAIRAGAAEYEGAQRTFRGALWVCSLVSAAVMAFSLIAALLTWRTSITITSIITAHDAAVLMFVFGLAVSLNFFLGVIFAGFRCCGKNATGIFLGNCSRLVEVIATGFMLWLDYSPVYVCLASFLIKLSLGVLQLALLRWVCPWLFTPRFNADKTIIKRLIKPSLAFLAFPLGNALALQGPILVIGTLFGSTAVATFSAMRTLSRVPYQFTFAFNSSVSPEMSLAYGSGDMTLLRKLHRKSWVVSISLVLLSALGIAVLGEWVVNIWLHKHAAYNALMLDGLLAVSVILAAWNVSSMVLVSVNQHAKIAIYYVIANGLGFIASYLMAMYFGILGLVLTLIIVEVVMLMVVFPKALLISKDSLDDFTKAILEHLPFSFSYKRN